MKQLMNNPYMFYLNRIQGIWDEFETSPAIVIGKATHFLIESDILKRENSITEMKQLVIRETSSRNYNGKDVTTQEIVDTAMICFRAYQEANLDLGVTIAVEHTIDFHYITKSGVQGPLPLKAIPDLVTVQGGNYHIWDWKTVSQFTNLEKENPDYILQSMFYFHAVHQYYGVKPEKMTFCEIHKKGSVQLWEINFNETPHYQQVFDKLYIEVVRDLLTRQSWLPSFSGFFDKETTWNSYLLHL